MVNYVRHTEESYPDWAEDPTTFYRPDGSTVALHYSPPDDCPLCSPRTGPRHHGEGGPPGTGPDNDR